jgi:hypothetical protein
MPNYWRAHSAHWRLTATLREDAASHSSHEELRSLHGRLVRALVFVGLI